MYITALRILLPLLLIFDCLQADDDGEDPSVELIATAFGIIGKPWTRAQREFFGLSRHFDNTAHNTHNSRTWAQNMIVV